MAITSIVKQARAAISLLNPDEVRGRAEQPVHIGLIASTDASYREMVDALAPEDMPRRGRDIAFEHLHRPDDPYVPGNVDLVLFEPGIRPSHGAYNFDPLEPNESVKEILKDHEDLGLPLARQFPAFRKYFVDSVLQSVARENAWFAIATALPNIVPNFIELPWAFGEFASDTAFLTANQIRMAFVIAAACGKDPSFASQKAEILAIGAGAFGWRALARELVGHIPFGGGLIPKGAIAYAGTFAVGKSLEYYHQANRFHTAAQRREIYRDAYGRGTEIAESLKRRALEPPSSSM